MFYSRITHYFNLNQNQELQSKPNIILLGIDSLSPESINKENMPFLNKLLNESTQFTNSISPLARTYPAWSSILTGLYAEHHHAEENLISKNLINSKASIIWKLNQLATTPFMQRMTGDLTALVKNLDLKK